MSSFPYKLHQLLSDVEGSEDLSAIISWNPTGEGFRIHKPTVFEKVLLKKFFPRQSKLKSFKRQVQYYGFENLGRNCYTHACFVKGQRSQCGKIMHKLPVKKTLRAAQKAGTSSAIATPVPHEVNSDPKTIAKATARRVSLMEDRPPQGSALFPHSSAAPLVVPGRVIAPQTNEQCTPSVIPSLCQSQMNDSTSQSLPATSSQWQEFERMQLLHRYNLSIQHNNAVDDYLRQLLARSA